MDVVNDGFEDHKSPESPKEQVYSKTVRVMEIDESDEGQLSLMEKTGQKREKRGSLRNLKGRNSMNKNMNRNLKTSKNMNKLNISNSDDD